MLEKKENESAIALNVVILPEEDVAAKAIKMSTMLTSLFPSEFTLDNSTFRPHITVYQGYFPNRNIDLLRASLQKLSTESQRFSVVMDNFWISPGRFVWWNARKSPEIMDFHQEVLGLLNPLREGLIAPPSKQQLSELGENERKNVLRTGGIYHGELYVPHITLTRLKLEENRQEVNEALGDKSVSAFEVDRALTASLGEHGTISTIVGQFVFGK